MSKNGEGKHGKHGHMHMHEIHKAEGGAVKGKGAMNGAATKMTSDSDGTSSGLPDSSGRAGSHGYEK